MSVVVDVAQVIAAQLAAFLALVLFASAVHKVLSRTRTEAVIQGFLDLPPQGAAILLPLVTLAEIVAGVLLWLPAYRAAGAGVAAAIWTVYLAVMARARRQGRGRMDCGCSFGASHQELGGLQLARSAVLTLLALGAGGLSMSAGPGPIAASQILAAFALFSLYVALDQVLALRPLREGELL